MGINFLDTAEVSCRHFPIMAAILCEYFVHIIFKQTLKWDEEATWIGSESISISSHAVSASKVLSLQNFEMHFHFLSLTSVCYELV